ncbi:4'-phosphopantetheinyl transferase superfamily protein [Pustulibacterium marinum]|uniref:4'-phosphopantetheinyl transferase superfamily protein n=1 Tax=Pustulibacterium marinum TaxID=1224947 RepID=A0A1I7EWQ0_9FLAO|nr:4'-phosphopantetheinyl transferase superfamily protein [Pustulibacterium marinum]SFU28309.1 4'-phosphopantetheinyl transferase superfamily protein [Pustulibacterium marinum]
MPLYKTITINPDTKLLIWKIEESFEALLEGAVLSENCTLRLSGMKSEIHKKGFVSIRHLLQLFGYTAHDLFYDENGKPHLQDGTHISISHSFQFAAVMIGKQPLGIDIEMQRPKILRIAHKFTTLDDYAYLANEDAIMRKLTMVWCAKESLYKLYATPGLSFLQHIVIDEFEMHELCSGGNIFYESKHSEYQIHYLEFDGFTCAYALPK